MGRVLKAQKQHEDGKREFVAVVRAAMEEGISQAEILRSTGIPRETLTRWRRQEQDPDHGRDART